MFKKSSGVNEAWFFLFSFFLNNVILALPSPSDMQAADKQRNDQTAIWVIPGECYQERLSLSNWPGSTRARSPKETLGDLLHYARKHPRDDLGTDASVGLHLPLEIGAEGHSRRHEVKECFLLGGGADEMKNDGCRRVSLIQTDRKRALYLEQKSTPQI